MPIISNIPEKFQKGFGTILNLSQETSKQLQQSLDEVTDAYTIRDLTDQLKTRVIGISEDDIIELVIAIRSLLSLIEQDEYNPEEIVNDISTIIEKGISKDIEYKNQDLESFRKVLLKLINSNAIGNNSKASELITSNQHTFLSARVITDIRPIFGKEINNSPKVISIVHNLKLHYEDNECTEHKDLYISLDRNDLKSLKELIIRAEEKEKSIQDMFKDTKIRIINLEKIK